MKIALLVLALAQDPIEEFRAAFDGARDEKNREASFAILARVRDPRVVDEASRYLARGSDAIRTAAAGVLAEYRDNETAALALLLAVDRQKSTEVKVALIRAYGATDGEGAARWLVPYVREVDFDIAQAAAEVAGQVRTGELVMPMIQKLAEMDAALAFVTHGRGETPEEGLQAALRAALRATTGQDLDKASAYAAWWKQNRATFRDPPDIIRE
jgi:HEAT repeat protein